MSQVVRSLFAAGLSLLAFACSAQDSSKFVEGKQYKKVLEVQKPADPKRIEVMEIFWYGCPHCYALDPELRKWEKTKPADVDFVRNPTSLGHPQGLLHSKAYYTAIALNVLPKVQEPLFDAIHKDNKPLSSEAQIGAVFQHAAGIAPDVFSGTFNSFVVEAQVNKAEQLVRTLRVTSVPTLIVGGKYMTGPAMAGGHEQTFATLDFLIDKVRKERGLKK